MKLVYESSGIEVKVGHQVALHDDELVTVAHFREPHKPSSQGKVTIEDMDGYQREYYVSVIGAKWIEREDQL